MVSGVTIGGLKTLKSSLERQIENSRNTDVESMKYLEEIDQRIVDAELENRRAVEVMTLFPLCMMGGARAV